MFSTLNSDLALQFIKYSTNQREEEMEGENTVEITEEVLVHLHFTNYFVKKKGRPCSCSKQAKLLQGSKEEKKRVRKL